MITPRRKRAEAVSIFDEALSPKEQHVKRLEDDLPKTYGKLIKFLGQSLVEARIAQDWASVAKLAREQALLIRTNPRRGRPEKGPIGDVDIKQLTDEELMLLAHPVKEESDE